MYIELKFLVSNLAIGGASVAPYIELKCIFREVVNWSYPQWFCQSTPEGWWLWYCCYIHLPSRVQLGRRSAEFLVPAGLGPEKHLKNFDRRYLLNGSSDRSETFFQPPLGVMELLWPLLGGSFK